MLFCKTIAITPPKPRKKKNRLGLISLIAFLFAACVNPMSTSYEKYEFQHWFEREDNDYTPDQWQKCLNVLAQLRSLGITKPERFKTLADAQYIVMQRGKLENRNIDPAKPVTIVMYPFIDGVGAFTAQYNSLRSIIIRSNQQLIYFEINGDETLKSALRLVKDNLPYEKEIVVILGGHGTKNIVLWDSGFAEHSLDPTDYDDQEFTNLLHSLNIKFVIFESCSTGGSGEKDNLNQADRMAEHIRIGGKVIAPTIDISRMNLIFNSDDSIQTITYDNGNPEIIYQANGQFSSPE